MTFLGEPVQAVVVAMAKGGLMRQVTMAGLAFAAADAAKSAVHGKESSAGNETPPRGLAVALTETELVLIAGGSNFFGQIKPRKVWRRLQRGSFQVSATEGTLVRRFTISSEWGDLELEAKLLGANHGNGAALDALVRSCA